MSASVVLAVLVVAGCGDSDDSSSPSTTVRAGASGTTTSAVASGEAVLGTATNDKIGEEILVDASGRTVYLYVPDGSSKTTTVPAEVLAAWPPVTSSADSATVGEGLDESKLSIEEQADGKQQVAYNGHLLYTFGGDGAAGDANGQGLGSVWYVLSAEGEQIS
jgi:predicted lipoprotein with Yx(FWY)xxD motif